MRSGSRAGTIVIEIGERRACEIADVAADLVSGVKARFSLRLHEGHLDELRAWEFEGHGPEVRPVPVPMSELEVRNVFYLGASDGAAHVPVPTRTFDFRKQLGVVEHFDHPTPFQEWLLHLEACELPLDPDLVPAYRAIARPLRLLRTGPAASSDIDEAERRLRVVFPEELVQLWQVSNGLCFFGQPLVGTYDVETADEGYGPLLVVLSQRPGPESVLILRVGAAGASRIPQGEVVLAASDFGEPYGRWPSIEAYLRDSASEVRTALQSPVA